MYDITSKWSFDGIDRWIKEVNEVSFKHVTPIMTHDNGIILRIDCRIGLLLTTFYSLNITGTEISLLLLETHVDK